jgi:hypothetical protein
MPQRKAAIAADDGLLSRSLSEMSAAEFVQLLGRDDVADARSLAILPDKKKYELWVDEDAVLKRPVGELLVIVRKEKKKLELEKFRIEDIKLQVEEVVDPGRFGDPVFDRARLVEDIASAVARKMGG